MKKILIPALCAVILVLSLAGCGGPAVTPSPTVLPSPTDGTVVSTISGKVTARKGNILTVDLQNGSLETTVVGEASPSATVPDVPHDTAASGPTGIAKGIQVVVPTNAPVTLSDGKTGTVADIRVGSTVTFTMISSVVTAVTVEKK